jgi:hypothetical protein
MVIRIFFMVSSLNFLCGRYHLLEVLLFHQGLPLQPCRPTAAFHDPLLKDIVWSLPPPLTIKIHGDAAKITSESGIAVLDNTAPLIFGDAFYDEDRRLRRDIEPVHIDAFRQRDLKGGGSPGDFDPIMLLQQLIERKIALDMLLNTGKPVGWTGV